MVKDHSDSEKGNPWPPQRLLFPINSKGSFICTIPQTGAGCSSVDSVPAFEAVGRRIDPSQWTQLQFGLFSVPTSGPQLVY